LEITRQLPWEIPQNFDLGFLIFPVAGFVFGVLIYELILCDGVQFDLAAAFI